MKKFGMMLALSAAMCGGVFAAEEVLKISEAGDFSEPVTIVEADGEKFFETGSGSVRSTKFFEVDPQKTYLLKGSFRNLSQGDIRVYFGFVPLDLDGKVILPQYVNCAKGTDAELAEAVKVGNITIKLNDGAHWEKIKGVSPSWFIAFNAKDDFSDLPNRDLSPRVDSANGNEVTLSSPIKKAYPAGTKVRAQHVSGSYIYTAANNRKTTDQWQEFSGKIQGEGWRPGTVKAHVSVLPYPSKDDRQAKIQFKDISVEIVD